MKDFIPSFVNKEEVNLNTKLIKRESEDDLVTFIVDIYKSLEVTGFITFLGYEVETDESKIDLSKYITTRRKVKKKDKNIKFQYIHPDRCIEIVLRFNIHVKDESANIKKSILIPKLDSNNYYTIRDKRYFLLYQLVDNSTYTSRNGLTLKSLMPLCINKNMDEMTDVEGNQYVLPYYFINVFKREIETFYFYFSWKGFAETMQYFSMDNMVTVYNDKDIQENDKDRIYFKLNSHLTVGVVKYFFNKFLYVRSMVLMIKRCIDEKTTFADLENKRYWVQRLGSLYTTTPYKLEDSGRSTITFFERLLDITTQKKVKVSDVNKKDVYAVVRWMVQNFIELKKKDNLDLNNKRLRLYEYVAALLSKKVGEGINRILTLGNKIKMKQVRDIFKFPGTIIFQLLYTAPLLKYDDRTNDLDAFSSLRYTIRGPNSLGARSNRNVSIKYRSCHPSYIGKLDLNTCSSSSPGLSGCCSPFAKTDHLWFNADKEPETQDYELYKSYLDYVKKHEDSDMTYVKSEPKNSDDYYRVKNNLEEYSQSLENSIIESLSLIPVEEPDFESQETIEL